MIRPYKYRVIDHSLLTPYMRQYVAGPVSLLLPGFLPANFITLFSNLFIYYALFRQLSTPDHPYNFWLLPLCLFLYTLGDHLDGMQAKKTGTGSPLGEYLDHYLDVFNSGIVVFLMANAYPASHSWLIVLMAGTTYLAHAMTMHEQYRTGWLVFEKIGSLEAVLLCVLFLAGSGIDSVRQIMAFTTPVGGLSVFSLILLFACMGGLGTLLTISRRSGAPGIKFYSYVALQITIFLLWQRDHFNVHQAILSFTLAAGSYIGSVMYGHLINGKEYFTDPFLWLAILSVAFWPVHGMLGLWLYGGLSILSLFAFTVYRLRSFWVWYNPLRKEEEN